MAPRTSSKWGSIFRSEDGPLTRELVRTPGRFGLGQLPKDRAPDAVVSMVCGFCSTGCGLTAHLREGVASNVSPDKNYPVNRGMACPKGWEALAPLESTDRAKTPLLRNKEGIQEAVDWDAAMQAFVDRFKDIQAKAWQGFRCIPRDGPDANGRVGIPR